MEDDLKLILEIARRESETQLKKSCGLCGATQFLLETEHGMLCEKCIHMLMQLDDDIKSAS